MYFFLSLHVLIAFLSIVYTELGPSKQANAVLSKIFITLHRLQCPGNYFRFLIFSSLQLILNEYKLTLIK